MGRAIGLKKTMFSGARIAGKHDPSAPQHMIYVPAHMKNGQFISQRVSFSAYVNSNRGKKDATGKVIGDLFNFTAWGKLADAIARSGSVGRALDLECTPTSYLKPITDAAGNPVMNRAGTQLQIPTVSFRIDNIVFAEEAAAVIANELATGLRPVGWDDQANQQAQTTWRQICAANNARVPDYQSGIFVNARVIMPQGQGIQLVDPETRAPINVQQPMPYAGNVAGVQQNVGNVMPGQTYQAPAPAAQPVQTPPTPPAGYAYNAQGQLVQLAPAPGAVPNNAQVNAMPGVPAPGVGAPAAAGAVY